MFQCISFSYYTEIPFRGYCHRSMYNDCDPCSGLVIIGRVATVQMCFIAMGVYSPSSRLFRRNVLSHAI